MLGWLKSRKVESKLAHLLHRRLFLHASLATTAGLVGCGGGGGGGGSSASGTPSTPSTPSAPTSWTQDYVANSGREWHVSPSGSDSAAGTAGAPFATLAHAGTVLAAGDTVILADGTYPGAVTLQRSGSPGHYITLRAANPGGAKLLATTLAEYSALNLKNAAWIRIEGLDLQGVVGHGIQAEGCHHIQLVDNICHDCGGSGISLNEGDYYLVEGNTVFGNSRTNTYLTSGISIYWPRAYDTAAGFHIIIRRNMVYDNVESVAHKEGNGIILDDFHNSQVLPAGSGINYTGSTLVENNLVAFNGGDGILAYESDNVTVRHNTVTFNNTDQLNPATWRSELANSQGQNNHWYNNIAVCDSSLDSNNKALLDGLTGSFQNSNAAWYGNLRYDINNPGNEAVLVGGSGNTYTTGLLQANNPLRSNPQFATTPVGGTADSFRLAAGSPAINSALTSYANTVDYKNSTRDSQPDIGALEA